MECYLGVTNPAERQRDPTEVNGAWTDGATIIRRIQQLGILWMWFCSGLWLVTAIFFLFYKLVVERWRPRTLSDFALFPILAATVYVPFLVTTTTQKFLRRRTP